MDSPAARAREILSRHQNYEGPPDPILVRREDALAAIEEALSRTPTDSLVGEWQDISTAPKDGTTILVAVLGWHPERPSDREYYVTAARWLWSNDAREPHESYPDDGAFFELNNDWTDTWGGNIGPTHWMPLPEPPKPV